MRRHILILVENLSVPLDRRVWQESRALVDAGYEVTVICPSGTKQDREREVMIEGVRILRYPLRAATGGPARLPAGVHGCALGTRCDWRSRSAGKGRIDVVQACNPPDLLFLIALALRPVAGAVRLRPPRPGAGTVRCPAFPGRGDPLSG